MAAVRNAADKRDRPDIYRQQIADLQKLRTLYQQTAMASGDWHTQTLKTVSASERLTEAIQKQKLSWKQARQEFSAYRRGQQGALREAIKEQAALRGAMAAQMTGQVFGKNNTDLFVPRNLGPELDNAKLRYGMINEMIRAAAHNTVNWGKNTQWAGRQITVGLTMPLLMASVGAAALAKQVDSELTKIAKVYDTTADSQMGKERELSNLREVSLKGATRMAQQYGQTMKDILDVEAQLAATGLRGNDLLQSTEATVRIGALGEMDMQTSVDMMVALKTAFKDQITTTDQLNRALNFFNATENATSLGIQDIAEAIPRAASAMAALGVSTDQMTVMLVAMREAGVDAAEAANALKSGTAAILDPSPEAVAHFKQVYGKDLPDLVKQAGGNMFDFMKLLGEAVHGFDPQQIQTTISEIFGRYQFNRVTALVTNFGDAMTGVGNQTAKAMELMGLSSEELAASAQTELERLQASISFKFTAAVEKVKAALVPLGMAVLEFFTPIISGIGNLIDGFNGLSGPVKATLMILAGGIALVGPLLMLVGIMANLFGNVIKAGTAFSNLFIRFKALNSQEAANLIMAKNATSMFNTQAQSSAMLAQQIRGLTLAMEENAVAQGLMMGRGGQMVAMGQDGARFNRQVTKDANGSLVYANGSMNAQGQNVSGKAVSDQDRAAWSQMQTSAGKVEESSKNTRTHWTSIGKSMGMIAAAGLMAFPLFMNNSESANESWVNIALIASSLMFMFPGMIGGLAKGVLGIGKMIKGWGPMIKGAFSGGNLRLMGSVMKDAFKQQGVRGIASGLGAIAPKFTAIAGTALRIFGPIGILAGGALIIKGVIEDMHEMEDAAHAVAKSGEDWANAVGFTYNPGQLPGMDEEDLSTSQKAIKLSQDMASSNEDLAAAMADASSEAQVYRMAMEQALHAITSGATPEQAHQVMEAALRMGLTDEIAIDKLMVRFEAVELTNPEEVRQALADQISGLISDAMNVGDDGIVIRPLDDTNDSVWDTVTAWFREVGGGDLSDEARTLGTNLGATLSDALNSAGDNVYMKAEAFDNIAEQSNTIFKDMFNDLKDDDALADAFKDLGIQTSDELAKMMADIRNKIENDEDLTAAQETLWHMMDDPDSGQRDALRNFEGSYDEWLDTIVQGMVDSGRITEDQAEEIKDSINSIAGLKIEFVPNVQGLVTAKEAADMYEKTIVGMGREYNNLSDEEKLAILNNYRAQAGMEAATSVAQGFGNGLDAAATAARNLADETASIAPSAEQMTNQLRSSMEGTMNDVYSEAGRQLDEYHKSVIDGMQDNVDATMKGYDQQLNDLDAYYDSAEKANDKHWDAVMKAQDKAQERETEAAESYWDAQEKAIEDAKDASDKWYDNRMKQLDKQQQAYEKEADARIASIQESIDAENEANDEREKIFEAEQRRIERLAERLNTSIDFNMALNSGDMDEAAKIANDASARESNWSLEDRNRDAGAASEARIKSLEEKISDIETERTARQEAHDAEMDRLREEQQARQAVFDQQLDQVKTARDAAMKALQERQEAEREALQEQKTIDQERLKSARDSARARLEAERDSVRQSMEADIEATRKKQEADSRSLEQRLRELQAFVPRNEQELNDHIAKVEQLYAEYGLNLQTQGNAWAVYIRDALERNIRTAAANMQNDINWTAVGNQINARIAGGIGVTAGDLQFFLRNGRFPNTGPITGLFDRVLAAVQGIDLSRHEGGMVFHNGGGPAFSQKDRVGVPRSATAYPSEVHALLKRGEFVVNERATRKNRGLLEGINSGSINEADVVRHDGGIADTAPLIMGGMGMMLGGALEAAISAAAMRNLAETVQYAAQQAALASGTLEGGDTIAARLFNTVKKVFPRANLNSGYRPGDPGYHGKHMAVDLGEQGFLGGSGRPYLADMNRWIYDNFRNSTQLIYDGAGDDRPDLFHGQNHTYDAGTQADHRNHVHWAMDAEAVAAVANRIAAGSAGMGAPAGAPGSVRAQVQAEANRWGFGSAANWSAIDWIVNHESSWNPSAQNPVSTASGLFQHIDATWRAYRRPGVTAAKMRLASVPEQAYAGMNYFKGRYGSPTAAQAFWQAHGSYDDGGWLKDGMMGHNTSGKPEPVFSGAQWDILKANIGNQSFNVGGSTPAPVRVVDSNVATEVRNDYNITIEFNGPVNADIDVKKAVWEAIDERQSRNGRRRVIS